MKEAGRWDLSPLYDSLEDPQIEKDFERLSKRIEDSRTFFETEAGAVEQIKEGVKLSEELSELVT